MKFVVYGTVVLVLLYCNGIRCDPPTYTVHEAPRAETGDWALFFLEKKCSKTNLERQGVLCEGYSLVVQNDVKSTKSAHQARSTFTLVPNQGYRPSIQISPYEYMISLLSYK